MQDFKKLHVWKTAHQWVLAIYKVARQFPAQEKYALRPQLLRAAVSIPANIAEGAGKNSPKEFAHFLQIAIGSCHECEYYLILAQDLNYLQPNQTDPLSQTLNQIRQQLSTLRKRVIS